MSKKDFEKLVDEYGRQVLNTALRIVGNIDSANDVHQEVFLKIFRRWGKFNGATNWAGYLYRVTVREAIQHARKTRLARNIDNQDEQIGSNNSPDDAMKLAELQAKLIKSLSKLPERQAEVFVLSRIEGLSYERIGEVFGCTQKTVRVHMHRALKRLAKELSDFLY